ncbi:MAG: S8 family serine peptidase [Verrucomicrobiota bacterium]
MNLNTRYVFAAALALSLTPLAFGQTNDDFVGQQGPPAAAPGQFIIKLKPGANAAAVAARHAVTTKHVFRAAVHGFSGAVPPGRLQALQADPSVEAVFPDRIVGLFAKPGGGGGTKGQVVPEGVKRIGAAPGALGTFTGSGVGVAIVDTGLDFAHADLQPFGSISFSAHGGNGQDDQGHGTHVGGTVAARNNNQDVVGVAPNVTLYAVKVLDSSGSGSDSDVIAGLDWVVANAATANPPIRVVNMSLGREGSIDENGDGLPDPMQEAIQRLNAAGVIVVVAAGNDCGLQVSQQVPATYPEVLAVASTTAKTGKFNRFGVGITQDTASYFTTDGAFDALSGVGVTISAPGEDQEDVNNGYFISSIGILSTRNGGGTVRLSGTSMASPHVAGVVALLWQQAIQNGVTLTTSGVRSQIRSSAFAIGSAPVNSPTGCYTFDGEREGVISAKGALGL